LLRSNLVHMKKISIILIFVFIIFIAGGFIIVNSYNVKSFNVLVYGVDGRNEDPVERSDAIILINYNYINNKMVATSIPRDSYVKITCKNNKLDKVNHAYAYGKEKCLKNTIAQLFDIKKLNYVMIKFDDVVKIIDYFGLIEIIPNHSFCQVSVKGDKNFCFEKNKKIQIDGEQALAYMRSRKSLPQGDFDRIKNQRQIMKIIISKFLKLSLLEKIKFINYINEIIETDLSIKNINVKKVVNMQQINLSEYTLKGEDYYDTYYYYKLDICYLEKIKKYYI